MSLQGKTIFITGASRGIGLSIALKAAKDGANIAIAAKTTEPHPKLEGTIFTAAEDIEKAGGKALPLQCDIRFEERDFVNFIPELRAIVFTQQLFKVFYKPISIVAEDNQWENDLRSISYYLKSRRHRE